MQWVNAVLVGEHTETLATLIACVDTEQQFQMSQTKAFETARLCVEGELPLNTVLFITDEKAWACLRAYLTSLTTDTVPFYFVLLSLSSDTACEAFDFGALDFMRPPLSSIRLQSCLNRIIHQFGLNEAQQKNDKIDHLLRQRNGSSLNTFLSALEHAECHSISELCSALFVKTGSSWTRLNLREILWLEAAGDYVCIYTQSGAHIVCRPLKYFENELCNDVFKRVSRSVIVNLNNVKGFTHCQNGGLEAQIRGDHNVKVGRRYRHTLDTVLS